MKHSRDKMENIACCLTQSLEVWEEYVDAGGVIGSLQMKKMRDFYSRFGILLCHLADNLEPDNLANGQ
jgi:hypothetical protein